MKKQNLNIFSGLSAHRSFESKILEKLENPEAKIQDRLQAGLF